MSAARRPRGLRGVARVGLLAAWVVFWLNTALFSCCEVAAAVLGGHVDNGSVSASAALPLQHSAAAQSEPLHQSPDAPCGNILISGPPLVGEHEVLALERFPLEWVAIDVPVATILTAVNPSAILALARASPPPPLRLYQRTQRLLI